MRIGCVISDFRHLLWAEECTFDYLEVKGDFILQLLRTGNLDTLLKLKHLPFEAMTSPLPRELGAIIVGDCADHTYALKIFTKMVNLSAMLGVQKIVIGSGRARHVPKHFNRDLAYEQFVDFINKAKCVTDKKQVLSIEPLHSGETNLINSCVEAQRVVSDIPEISITADCYHIFTEQQSLNDELSSSKITHAHTSCLPRGSGIFREEYQRAFLNKIKATGCNDISIEEVFNSKTSMRDQLLKLRKLTSNSEGKVI